jgi:vancomycin resistance protein YoaR
VREPFEFSLTLEPGELFAFHDELSPEFNGLKTKTGWTQFSVVEGYKVLDGLSGNGVCHLATLINWVSTEAGLAVTAKVNHDFYPVPGIDRKYGTSIVYLPGAETTRRQNLYVVNTYDKTVTYNFKASAWQVTLEIVK